MTGGATLSTTYMHTPLPGERCVEVLLKSTQDSRKKNYKMEMN